MAARIASGLVLALGIEQTLLFDYLGRGKARPFLRRWRGVPASKAVG